MENEVSTLRRQHFEVEARSVIQAGKYSSPNHQCEKLEVLVYITESILLLQACYYSLTSC